MEQNPWIKDEPHPKQRQLLLLADVREVFYGGAARGGKTKGTLMGAAQYVDVPGYRALILRRTFAELHQSDGFIEQSRAWWGGEAQWSEKHTRWTFPSGATISFGYLERNDHVYQYKGAQLQFIDVDELTDHTEWRYLYMSTRLSRPIDGPLSHVPLRLRSQSNPGGKGHEWVKRRFIDPATRKKGVVFIPAKLEDNPSADRLQYIQSLSIVDPITRAQLLNGDWNAHKGGRFADLRRFKFLHGTLFIVNGHEVPMMNCWTFITVDPAASSEETCESDDPDYTVIAVWAVTPAHELLWIDCVRVRLEVPDIVPLIHRVYRHWKAAFVGIEAIAANSAVYQLASRTVMAVKKLNKGPIDKLVHATKAIVMVSQGRVYLPEAYFLGDGHGQPACPVEDVESEISMFTGNEDEDAHDDCVDCLSYAAAEMEARQSRGAKPFSFGSR